MTRPIFFLFLFAFALAACAPRPVTVIYGTPVANPPAHDAVDKKALDMLHSEIQTTKDRVQDLLDHPPVHQ